MAGEVRRGLCPLQASARSRWRAGLCVVDPKTPASAYRVVTSPQSRAMAYALTLRSWASTLCPSSACSRVETLTLQQVVRVSARGRGGSVGMVAGGIVGVEGPA